MHPSDNRIAGILKKVAIAFFVFPQLLFYLFPLGNVGRHADDTSDCIIVVPQWRIPRLERHPTHFYNRG